MTDKTMADVSDIPDLFEVVLKRHVVLSELRDIYRARFAELLRERDRQPVSYMHG